MWIKAKTYKTCSYRYSIIQFDNFMITMPTSESRFGYYPYFANKEAKANHIPLPNGLYDLIQAGQGENKFQSQSQYFAYK